MTAPRGATGRAETIFALASGAGRAGVAVVRVSGSAAGVVLQRLCAKPLPRARHAVVRTLLAPDGGAIDRALVLWMPGPNSFTGEDIAELHIHGGQAVIAALVAALARQPECRPAEAGEFTRRAFENGRLDLAQAEGLADLVDAETEAQRRQALRQMEGALSALYEGWRARLITAMALLEAEIDFPDEDLPGGLSAQVGPLLTDLIAGMTAHLQDAKGERIRDGYRIAIIGAPNVGKSSLLNALARDDAAIVSDIPGTTRDVVEVRLVLAGYPVWLADTAGLREANDAVEREGVRRALARAQAADLVLGVFDAARPAETLSAALEALRPHDLLVMAKHDLAQAPSALSRPALPVSAATGAGVADLEAALRSRVEQALGQAEAPALTRERHRRLATLALEAVQRAQASLALGPELAAEDLRAAAAYLGRLTGRIDVEDLLDEVFAKFCIGK